MVFKYEKSRSTESSVNFSCPKCSSHDIVLEEVESQFKFHKCYKCDYTAGES